MEFNGKQVFIVGPHRIQNGLMASYVNAEAGLRCTVLGTLQEFRHKAGHTDPEERVVLNDCPGPTPQAVRQQLLASGLSPAEGVLAMFNVPPDKSIERETISLGIRGFFYDSDSPETLLKGIRALFRGELWMSRKVLSDCVLKGFTNGRSERHSVTLEEPSTLTRRELEVLASVAAGASNEIIADRLCISAHTVKSHVYRIFRKVGVSNRLEAALWAANNL